MNCVDGNASFYFKILFVFSLTGENMHKKRDRNFFWNDWFNFWVFFFSISNCFLFSFHTKLYSMKRPFQLKITDAMWTFHALFRYRLIRWAIILLFCVIRHEFLCDDWNLHNGCFVLTGTCIKYDWKGFIGVFFFIHFLNFTIQCLKTLLWNCFGAAASSIARISSSTTKCCHVSLVSDEDLICLVTRQSGKKNDCLIFLHTLYMYHIERPSYVFLFFLFCFFVISLAFH